MASSLELIKFLVDGGADLNLRHLSVDTTLCIMLSQRVIVGQSVTFEITVQTFTQKLGWLKVMHQFGLLWLVAKLRLQEFYFKEGPIQIYLSPLTCL